MKIGKKNEKEGFKSINQLARRITSWRMPRAVFAMATGSILSVKWYMVSLVD
jgi:hypothetical protein